MKDDSRINLLEKYIELQENLGSEYIIIPPLEQCTKSKLKDAISKLEKFIKEKKNESK